MKGKERCGRIHLHPCTKKASRFLAATLGFLSCMGLIRASGNPAVTEAPSEYKVKAAFLYSFTKFVEWPPSRFTNSRDPVPVCVFGSNPFGGTLQEILAGKTFNGRPFEVKEVTSGPEARPCLILFISSAERKRLKSVLQSLAGAPILTIGDSQGFAEEGCVIDFVTEDNKLRFEINMTGADRAGLKISSKLLSLARIVNSEKAQQR